MGGGCGSCYVFATNAALEARIRIATNNQQKPRLSVLEVVACSPYSQGCDGGVPYLIHKHFEDFGVAEESCVPYSGMQTFHGVGLSISDFLQGADHACQAVHGEQYGSCGSSKRW